MFDPKEKAKDDAPGLPQGELQPLSTLKRGQSGVIMDVGGQETAARQRLMEMGFIPGAYISVFNTGDPMLVELNGNKIGLGRSLLRDISVMVLE
jgi:Fe2+ transport system protein FeoA